MCVCLRDRACYAVPAAPPHTVVPSSQQRGHGLKYQAVQAPCGLTAHLYGPVAGRRADGYMLAASGLIPMLNVQRARTGVDYCIYCDAAYPFIRSSMLM